MFAPLRVCPGRLEKRVVRSKYEDFRLGCVSELVLLRCDSIVVLEVRLSNAACEYRAC